ncbi:hypothetical protein DFH11DRAFT_1007345 [Phellopilus nigrolimitatus]|nr:hypothetical protein DFH11DRAFT_1007345 [Phellopilus nigrolimitatus]
MVDVFEYLKQTKNALVGNPSAKLELQRTQEPAGSLLASIVSYVNLNPPADAAIADSSYSEETTVQIRVEAANVIASLAHVLNALADLSDHSPHLLQVAIIRALRALYVAIADGTGPSLWGLGEECLEFTSEMRTALDFMFQSQALNVYLPLLASSSPFIRLYISQLLAFAVRVPNHRIAVTDWLPPGERLRESKGKRGWEVSALVDVNSPGRSGGWVIRHLTTMLKSKDFKTQEASLYAIAALVKDNTNIALVLSKSPPENKAYHILSIAADFSRDRRSEVRLAACLWYFDF